MVIVVVVVGGERLVDGVDVAGEHGGQVFDETDEARGTGGLREEERRRVGGERGGQGVC